MVSNGLFSGAFAGASVFVTGHTGFKGAWLCEWLLSLGAAVTGYSDEVAEGPTLFGSLGIEDRMTHILGDVRDLDALTKAIDEARPDYVFHLAAQPLVRLSYAEPAPTFATNVMGTINVMEALRVLARPVACVLVTSDKCYENREVLSGYREDDPLGGYDPYSASKGAAEIAIHAYRRSFFSDPASPVKIASGRAGNVIGGGDWSGDRIVPDCARSLIAGEPITVRNPYATRPWQHVLESLSGYLWLGALLGGEGKTARVRAPMDASESFNFGPWPGANRTVEALVSELLVHWPGSWEHLSLDDAHHEAGLLGLSVDRAYHKLAWTPSLGFEDAVALTASWYRDTHQESIDALAKTRQDIEFYVAAAQRQGIAWAVS
ncbi:MAG: CDP-glucose 4,6-dehydratase [Pseudomonadota bacterium]